MIEDLTAMVCVCVCVCACVCVCCQRDAGEGIALIVRQLRCSRNDAAAIAKPIADAGCALTPTVVVSAIARVCVPYDSAAARYAGAVSSCQ